MFCKEATKNAYTQL